jgi:hypothetical protein
LEAKTDLYSGTFLSILVLIEIRLYEYVMFSENPWQPQQLQTHIGEHTSLSWCGADWLPISTFLDVKNASPSAQGIQESPIK